MAVGTQMLQRRATAASWATSNVVLGAGELGVTTDTGIIKIGNGTSHWVDLPVAFASDYLPVLGTAVNSALVGGVSVSSLVKYTDGDTAATASKYAVRGSSGRLKFATGVSTDDGVNYAQMVAADTATHDAAVIDGRKEVVIRTVTANFTLALTDIASLIIVNNSAYTPSLTCTIPTNATVAFPIGSWIDVSTSNKGPATLTPAGGVTLVGPTVLYGGGSSFRLLKTDTDSWLVMHVTNSPSPIVRRHIKTGANNTLTSGSFVPLRLDGSGTATFTPNADTLGTNEQYNSASDLYKVYCRRSGWYEIFAQVSALGAQAGRFYVQVNVNGVSQEMGAGKNRNGSGEMSTEMTGLLPLNVNDYVEISAYQDSGSSTTVSESVFATSVFEWSWRRPL